LPSGLNATDWTRSDSPISRATRPEPSALWISTSWKPATARYLPSGEKSMEVRTGGSL
jgi:hypothetical protein